ncbi:MAG TPA: TylF/MycF/NovP-related O-methyltransferase [Anaerovoracaceae bacterium]|nr:TylF/MycF/NovP-related O-methyltransferase [Anaerovoracaceae bacterium]
MYQKKVIIYGAGQCGIIAQTWLKRDLNIIGFADRREELQGKRIGGLTVIDPEKIPDYGPDLIVIAVLNAEQDRLIRDWLLESGITGERILSIRSLKEYVDARFSAARLIAEEINSRDVPGAVAELGVYKGEFAALINELFPDRGLYLFDTFEGFNAKDIAAEIKGGLSFAAAGDFRDTSVDLVRSRLPFPERAVFRKGYFPDTALGIEKNFAFVSIDADLYQPVYEGLKYFWPRMNKGGYILIHDYNSLQYQGAGMAVRQFCGENDLFVVPLSDMHGSAVLIKA